MPLELIGAMWWPTVGGAWQKQEEDFFLFFWCINKEFDLFVNKSVLRTMTLYFKRGVLTTNIEFFF